MSKWVYQCLADDFLVHHCSMNLSGWDIMIAIGFNAAIRLSHFPISYCHFNENVFVVTLNF